MPQDDYLERIDQSAARLRSDDTRLSQWLSDYARNHRHRLAADLRMLAEFTRPDSKVLEFGSMPPLLTLAAREMGCDICGLDLAPERVTTAPGTPDLDIRKTDFEREAVPFPDETFDVVLFNEVFEHLRIDLIRTMTEVRRVMKTGGTLLLSTPNLRSVRGLWQLLRRGNAAHIGADLYDEYAKLRLYGHMGHVREYTAHEVSRFLSRIGLTTRQRVFRYHRPARGPFGLFEAAVGTVMPSLRPLFSLVCEKTAPPPA
jgi:2-polyprenyl-3-methyl-5-hydroxy-6-metoxy-1,4-benzoquinol methylase